MKNKKVVFKTEISKDFDSFEEAKEFALSIYNNKTEKEKNSENGDEFVYYSIIDLDNENNDEEENECHIVFSAKSYFENELEEIIKDGIDLIEKEFLYKSVRLEYLLTRLNDIFMNSDEEIDDLTDRMKYENLFYKINNDINISFDFEILNGKEENVNIFIYGINIIK